MGTLIKQGQSALATEAKQRGLGYVFKVNSNAFMQFRDRYTLFHFDLNCGSGYNEEIGCIGSPITFIRCMEEAGIENYSAHFCDKDKDAIASLIEKIDTNRRCFPHCGSNEEFCDMIPGIIAHYGDRPKFAMGTVLCDPNGYEIPVASLQWLNRQCPKIDVIIHWNSTSHKRARKAGHQSAQQSLPEVIDQIGKKHWLIRQPIRSDQHQFTMLIGRNHQFGDYKAQGYYRLNTQKGQDILSRCQLTAAEYMEQGGQGDLF